MDNYTTSMNYEIFIRRAHSCDRDKKGASVDYFRNLQNTESGQLKLALLGTAEKQRAAVKKYLAAAVAAFVKPRRGRKLTAEETAQLQALLPRIEQSTSADELMPLIKQGLAITHPYINS